MDWFEGKIFSVHTKSVLSYAILQSQGWNLLRINPHQDCPSNRRNGQIKQGLAEQHYQLRTQVKLYKPLVTLISFYGCETWALLTASEKRIRAFETKSLKRLLGISYLEHQINDWVWSKSSLFVGPQEPLLANGKRRKLASFEQVTRHNSLSKTILLEGGRRRDRQRKCWMDNSKVDIPAHTKLLTAASLRTKKMEEGLC